VKLDYCPWCSVKLLAPVKRSRGVEQHCKECWRYVRGGKWFTRASPVGTCYDCAWTVAECRSNPCSTDHHVEVAVDPPEMVYTKDELLDMVVKMRATTTVFYGMATKTGCHTFIEFCGLMNKYIDVCERAAKSGIDFTSSSIHGAGFALPVEGHDVAYLAEKFSCIFAQTMFKKPHVWDVFKHAVEHEVGGG
jgi:hypothetical protein